MPTSIFHDIFRGSLVPEICGNQARLLIRGDPLSGEMVLADRNGFILTPSEFYAIVSRVNAFYESSGGYDDERIDNLNAEFAKGRGVQYMKDEKIDAYTDRSGTVYLIRADNELYKIGCTTNVDRRLAALRAQSPCEIKLVCTIEAQDRYEAEHNLHHVFHKKRIRGEWFELDEADIEQITALAEESENRPLAEEVET